MGPCRLLKTIFAQFLGKYRVVSALFGKIERLTFTGTFDAFQHLVKSHSFKQICFPHRSEMGVLKSFQKSNCTGAFTLIRRIFHPPAPVFGPGFRPEQPPGPDRLPPFFIAGDCARTSVSPSQDHARPCGGVGGRSEGTNRSTSRVRARK